MEASVERGGVARHATLNGAAAEARRAPLALPLKTVRALLRLCRSGAWEKPSPGQGGPFIRSSRPAF